MYNSYFILISFFRNEIFFIYKLFILYLLKNTCSIELCKIYFFNSSPSWNFFWIATSFKNHLSERRATEAKIIYLFCPFRKSHPLTRFRFFVAYHSFIIFYFIILEDCLSVLNFLDSCIHFWLIDITERMLRETILSNEVYCAARKSQCLSLHEIRRNLEKTRNEFNPTRSGVGGPTLESRCVSRKDPRFQISRQFLLRVVNICKDHDNGWGVEAASKILVQAEQ